MNKYIYDGPVKVFDRCVADHWKGETMAVSERKARSNLSYQYKYLYYFIASVKVTLTGKIAMVD